MRKQFMAFLAAGLLAAAVPFGAGATELPSYEGPEWPFEVALSALNEDYLVLANAASPLAEDYVPSGLQTLKTRRNDDEGNNANGGIYMASNVDVQLVKAAANSLVKMVGDAEGQGVVLYVRQGYRSYADQVNRYARAEEKGDTTGTQPAGQCDFQTGLAVTLVGKAWRAKALTADFASSSEAQWIKSNCARYGFILRYPEGKESETGYASEPWHLRFVGKGVASYIQLHNQCLEEFHVTLEQAYSDFAALGGNVKEAMAAAQLPEGAVVLNTMGPDGDHEIVLFHD